VWTTRAIARALKLDPALPEVQNAIGRGLIAESRFDEARAALEKAVQANSDFDPAWANLGRAHQGLGHYAEGLDAIRKAIQLNPNSFRHRIALGNFYRSFREIDEALAAYREAVDLKPNSVMAWNNAGTVLLLKKQYQEAADAFSRSIEFEPRASTYTNLGTAHYYMQQYDLAEKDYRHAIELDSTQALYDMNLGDALRMLGRDAEARQAYARAAEKTRIEVQRTPQNAAARVNLAFLLAKAGDAESAIEEATTARRLEPANAAISLRSAIVLCILDRVDPALAQLEAAVKLGATRAEIENDPDLQQLREIPRFQKILGLAS
jgi:tetratricopeptide (TPR) repeat protein